MKRQNRRSNCPINFALETFGDTWSLLIIRDIVFWRKRTFKEFQESKEGIASNILASRLSHLVEYGVLAKRVDENDRRKTIYQLTDKGLDLIPMLLEISGWSTTYDAMTTSPKDLVAFVYANRETMFKMVRETVARGGSLFVGEDCVVKQLLKRKPATQ